MLSTSKVSICWPNRTDQALLSGGSYSMNLPLVNAKNRVFAKKARTADLNTSSTRFSITLDKTRGVGVVAIAAHNMTAQAQWRVVVYADIQRVTTLYDSGLIDVWPGFFQPDQLEWEDNNFWFGEGELDEASMYTALATHFFPDNISAQLVDVFLEDTLNPDNYIQFGRVFLSEVFQPTVNMDFGVQYGHENPSSVETSLSGTEYFDRQRLKRTVQFNLGFLTREEAFLRLYAMQRDQGIDKEILFAQEVQDSDAFYFRTFIGRLKQADPISQPYLDRHSMGFDLLEIV